MTRTARKGDAQPSGVVLRLEIGGEWVVLSSVGEVNTEEQVLGLDGEGGQDGIL